jgi:hypothetical protein
LREGRDAAVIFETARVEHDGIDPRGFGSLADDFADLLRGREICQRLQAVGNVFLTRRRRDERVALGVVDDGRVDVVQRA